MNTKRFTVKIRRDFVRDVRDNAEQIDGKTFVFRFGWPMEDDDPYPGEDAWIPEDDNYPRDAPHWLASGDLI